MKAVVTVSGTDRRGIIAKVSVFLSEKKINIEDISQTIMGDCFAMIMMVEMSDCGEDFALLAEEMEALGREIGMSVRIRHADIFDAMHKI